MRRAIRIACWTLVLTLALVLVAVAFSYREGRATPPQAQSNQKQEIAAKGERLEAELITLQEWGFEPKEINRPPGPFVAVFENHSGFPEVKLSLKRESGPEVSRIPVTRNVLNSRQRLQLPPGTYVVKDANHPDWECRITIAQP